MRFNTTNTFARLRTWVGPPERCAPSCNTRDSISPRMGFQTDFTRQRERAQTPLPGYVATRFFRRLDQTFPTPLLLVALVLCVFPCVGGGNRLVRSTWGEGCYDAIRVTWYPDVRYACQSCLGLMASALFVAMYVHPQTMSR